MVTIPRPTPTTRATYTAGADYVRGTGSRDILGYTFTTAELAFLQPILNANTGNENAVYDAFFTGEFAQFGRAPNLAIFNGNDTIFGRGGNDYVVDLVGNNSVTTDVGSDRILLGFGNDRIYDQGGDNDIFDYGGDNVITTRDGNDMIATGAGNDNVNAFDGTNFVNAGDGDNIVRGGDGLDIFIGGLGDDFFEVQGGSLVTEAGLGFPPLVQAVDENEDPVFDENGNPVWAEHTAFIDLSNLYLFLGGIGFVAHNVMLDYGGDDTFRASSTSRNDLPGFPDRVFNGDDLVVSDISVWEFALGTEIAFSFEDGAVVESISDVAVPAFSVGTDTMNLGGGDNHVLDFAGDTTVVTLEGDDWVYTSWFADVLGLPGDLVGNDDISVGAGNDTVSSGWGHDTVRGGPGADSLDIGIADGYTDSLVYREGDLLPLGLFGNTVGQALPGADTVLGFERSVDEVDVRGLDLSFGRIFQFGFNDDPATPVDIALVFDIDQSNSLTLNDAVATYLVDVAGPLSGGDFLFA